MDEPTRLNFRRPRFMIRSYWINKKDESTTLDIPAGGEIIGVEALGDKISVKALLPLDQDLPMVPRTILIVEEGVAFEMEDMSLGPAILPDGTMVEDARVPVADPIGSWVEERVAEDGSVRLVTMHVLEMGLPDEGDGCPGCDDCS